MSRESVVTSTASDREINEEVRLRPQNFSEFIGQKNVVDNISLMVASAQKRSMAMDHVLLSGPPGLGKTSLAMIIAGSLGSELHMVAGPAIEKKGDLAAVLTNIAPRDVLFIDEIHRIPIAVEEILYSAMEDFRLDILIGQGASARTMQIDIAPFTLIGATTRSGLLSNPLRDRFMAHLNFNYYEPDEIAIILETNARKMNLTLEKKSLNELAKRSRGTPRIANRILRRVRDFAVVEDKNIVEMSQVEKALNLMDIDHLGLDAMDRKILQVILEYYQGGPVGIEALSATLGEDRQTIEEVYEPYLLSKGLLIRSPRGRMISDLAKQHLNY